MVELIYIKPSEQVADIFAKSLKDANSQRMTKKFRVMAHEGTSLRGRGILEIKLALFFLVLTIQSLSLK